MEYQLPWEKMQMLRVMEMWSTLTQPEIQKFLAEIQKKNQEKNREMILKMILKSLK